MRLGIAAGAPRWGVVHGLVHWEPSVVGRQLTAWADWACWQPRNDRPTPQSTCEPCHSDARLTSEPGQMAQATVHTCGPCHRDARFSSEPGHMAQALLSTPDDIPRRSSVPLGLDGPGRQLSGRNHMLHNPLCARVLCQACWVSLSTEYVLKRVEMASGRPTCSKICMLQLA
jgi:hypothetical protein